MRVHIKRTEAYTAISLKAEDNKPNIIDFYFIKYCSISFLVLSTFSLQVGRTI